MKTAISLPDDLFDAVVAKARALKVSRSSLLAQAAREFIAKGEPSTNATDAWNRALAKGGQPGDEPAAIAFRTRAKRVVKDSWRKVTGALAIQRRTSRGVQCPAQLGRVTSGIRRTSGLTGAIVP